MNFAEVKQDIIDRMSEYTGRESVYVSDIGYLITECENANGSWYCSTFKAKEDLKNSFDEFGLIYECMRQNFDYDENPFIEPEKAHCAMMITLYVETIAYAFSKLDIDDEVDITDDLIKQLEEVFESVKFSDIFR